MSSANLNIIAVQRRMLSQSEAAMYCGLPAKKFTVICSVSPTEIGGKRLFDKKRLDRWLDELASGEHDSDETVLGKL